MKKMLLVTVALACSAIWGFAQTSTSPASPSGADQSSAGAGQSSASASSSASPVTVDGCLAGASGSYTLKDKATGATYNLAGDTSKLAAHVGHELQITGTTNGSASATSGSASSSASSTPSASSSSSGGQTLNMTAAKMVSASCSAQ